MTEIDIYVSATRFAALSTLALALAFTVGCSDDTSTDAGSSPTDTGIARDVASGADAAPDTLVTDTASTGDLNGEPDASTLPVEAAHYCELTVDMFCDYYLRCGRMAVDDVVACRTVFLETCDAVYEPVYQVFETGGALALSGEGIEACRVHLETVQCEQQIFDLDGGCSSMWQGQIAAGGPCAPGIGSFVCDDSSVCVIGLDFCGTCKPIVGFGEPCDVDTRCPDGSSCIESECVRRRLPGETCTEDLPCVLGAGCVEGFCATFEVVRLSDECDADRRCPYKSVCSGGRCEEIGLLGEACTSALPCASGYCEGGFCERKKQSGRPCLSGAECLSGACGDDGCAPLPGACFD